MNTILREQCHFQKLGLLAKKIIVGSLAVLFLGVSSGCSIHISQYSDGKLTDYFHQSIPKLQQPIAATLSLEVVDYQTAASMKGTMVSDLGAREIFLLPSDVGKQVEDLLQLDREFSMKTTKAALNAIAKARVDARALHGFQKLPGVPVASASSNRYIEHHSKLSKEAYSKGDYLGGDIHNAAAANRITIDQSFDQAQATANLAFGMLGAMAAAGEAMIKNDFNDLRNWLVTSSGAIGPRASKDRHLSVFFLQFFDAERFKLDSRMRVAVLLVLIDESSVVDTVLEGSDLLTCVNECKLFSPKPTAKLIDHSAHSRDVQDQLWSKEGLDYLTSNGFDSMSGIYQYLLLQQGLRKLQTAKQK